MSLTNLTLTSLKYKKEMSLDHLKQFLLTVLDAKSVMARNLWRGFAAPFLLLPMLLPVIWLYAH